MLATTIATTTGLAPPLAADAEPAKWLDEAGAVFSEVMTAPDHGIPLELEKRPLHRDRSQPRNRGVQHGREVRRRLPVMSKQGARRLVGARHRYAKAAVSAFRSARRRRI